MAFVKEFLEAIQEWTDSFHKEDGMPTEGAYDRKQDRLQKAAEKGGVYFMHYWLDKEDLTEHGGSVGGAWLSEKGEEILRYLREAIPDKTEARPAP
jgi:hypothetical protein